ncbi:hypothetical protein FHN83_14610 [Leclercia adecarboxylata]|nr:hypothetical protein FHN83_14610 [Leclercia adecarboxylata]
MSINNLSSGFKKISRTLVSSIVFIWNFIESALFIGGLIMSIMLPVAWPMKFFYAAVWLVLFYICSKVVGMLENYRNRKN